MTDQERKFYDYLISLPENLFDNWLEKAPQEEIDLADQLFDEMKFKHLDEVDSLDEANQVLKQFTLKG